jgi:ketosteroid isomerase-like protein
MVALSHADVEWHSFFGAIAGGGVFRGHDGTREYLEALDEAWEVGYGEIDDALGCGDIAVFVGRIHYRGRGSGVEDAAPAGWTLVFRDGKLARFQAFRDPEHALARLGRES